MARHKSKQYLKSDRLDLVSCKRSTISVARTMVSIQLFAVLTIALQCLLVLTYDNRLAQAANMESHEEEHLENPLVHDPSTLYDRARLAASGQTTAAIAGRRFKRATESRPTNQEQPQALQVVDACQSKVEILTPYYATNSKGKLRTVVNSALMQQAVQVETCVRSSSADRAKCNKQPDCGCEQKYKWHRLLVLDTSDSGASRGLFMDWFLYPSACVCRCRSPFNLGKQRQ